MHMLTYLFRFINVTKLNESKSLLWTSRKLAWQSDFMYFSVLSEQLSEIIFKIFPWQIAYNKSSSFVNVVVIRFGLNRWCSRCHNLSFESSTLKDVTIKLFCSELGIIIRAKFDTGCYKATNSSVGKAKINRSAFSKTHQLLRCLQLDS